MTDWSHFTLLSGCGNWRPRCSVLGNDVLELERPSSDKEIAKGSLPLHSAIGDWMV